jgi:hypothetical protein
VVPAPRPAARRWASPAPQVREPALQQQATPAYQESAPQVGPRPLQLLQPVPEVTRQQLAPAPRVAAPRLDPAPQVRPQQLPRAPQVRQPAQAQPGGTAAQAAQLTKSTGSPLADL